MRWTDGLRLAPALARTRLPGALPYKLLLSLTDACNHRCLHCRAWERPRDNELSPGEIRTLLAGLPSLRWLDLTGGEPTTRADWPEVADAVREGAPRLVFLHFATNGFLPERAVGLARRLRAGGGPPLVVTVSLDGDEPLHDRIRGRPGAFRRAVESARALQALPGVEVFAGTTVTPENAAALPRVHAALGAALPGLLPDRWHVNLMNLSPHFFANAGQAVPDVAAALAALDVVEHLRPLRGPFALAEWVFVRGLRRHLRTGRAPAPCVALRDSAFVAADGQVYPCHLRPTRLGGVREHGLSLAAVLRSPAARAERARIAAGCDGCWTPCEAYHAILAAPLRCVARALGPASRSRGPSMISAAGGGCACP